ncbi:MAG: hypothetical protein KDB24_17530, partial [Microthrixaceae bacterium]|nr:hypothetical protein [Microthrixaceae bacterium]
RRRLLAALAGAPMGAALVACGCSPSPGGGTTTTGSPTTGSTGSTSTTVAAPTSWAEPIVDSGADGLMVPEG